MYGKLTKFIQMKLLMITWTDIFEGTGTFFYWCFKGMRALSQMPNVLMGGFVIFLLAYWTLRLMKYKKQAASNGTYE